MILIRVTYRTRPGERDAFIKALLDEDIPACTRKETGNHAYDFMLSIEDPDVVCLVEQWENQTCLEEHIKQTKFHRLSELREILGVSRDAVAIYNAEVRHAG